MNSENKINQVVYSQGLTDGYFEFHFFFKGFVEYHKKGEIDAKKYERSDDQKQLEIKEFLSELKVISLDADYIKIGHNKSCKVWQVTIRQDKTNKLNWYGWIAPTEEFYDFSYDHGEYSSNAGFEVHVEWIPWSDEIKQKYPLVNVPKPWPDNIGNTIIGQIVMAIDERKKGLGVISFDPALSMDDAIEDIPFFKKIEKTLGKKVLKRMLNEVKKHLSGKIFKDIHPISFNPTPEMMYDAPLPSIGLEGDFPDQKIEIPTSAGIITIKVTLRVSPEFKKHSVIKAEVVKKELKMVTSTYGSFSSQIKITDKGVIEASNQINLGKFKVSYGVEASPQTGGIPSVTCMIASKPFEVSNIVSDRTSLVSENDIQAIEKTLVKFQFSSSIKITISLIPNVPLNKPEITEYKIPIIEKQKIPEEVFKTDDTFDELLDSIKKGSYAALTFVGWLVVGILLALLSIIFPVTS